MYTEGKRRLIASAVFALECIILVTSAPESEIKTDIFAEYNEMYTKCRPLIKEYFDEPTRKNNIRTIEDEMRPWPQLNDFEEELKLELQCLYWIMRERNHELKHLMVTLYSQYLAIHYKALVSLQQSEYKNKGIEKGLSDEEQVLVKDMDTVVGMLHLFGSKTCYGSTVKQIMHVRKLRASINIPKEELENTLENEENELKKFISDVVVDTVGMLKYINGFIERFLPGCILPVTRVPLLTFKETSILLEKVQRSNVLNPGYGVKGSRFIKLLKALVLGDHEIEKVSASASASSSASTSTIKK